MQKRRLGRTDLDIAPLVLGGNVFGWTADEKTSFDILDRFLDSGLNAVDTADSYSRWVPGIPGLDTTYEGFGYLGVGVLMLGVVAAALVFYRRPDWPRHTSLVPLIAAGILMYLFAQATPVTVAGYEVMTARGFYESVEPIVAPLRATGRFVWPLHYIALTGVLAVLVRQHGPFAWGQDALAAVENARALELVARMDILVRATGARVAPPARFLVDKHFLRKHGTRAYYGQK